MLIYGRIATTYFTVSGLLASMVDYCSERGRRKIRLVQPFSGARANLGPDTTMSES